MESYRAAGAPALIKCSMLECAMCSGLDLPIRMELERLARIRRFHAGETVLGEQETVTSVGNVVAGILRMQKTLLDGRQQIVGLLLPHDMFGRVFTSVSHVAIEAATDATLCCYNRVNFEELIKRHSELEHRVLRSVAHELDAAQDWMLLLATQTVTERVATFLLLLWRRARQQENMRKKSPQIVEVPISRKDVASYLGTTVESVSRSIQSMVRGNAISIVDTTHIQIENLGLLLELSGRDRSDFHEGTERRARTG